MPAPTIGSRPGGAPSSRPGGSPSIVRQLNDIFARSGGSSPVRPTTAPTPTANPSASAASAYDRYIAGKSPAPQAPFQPAARGAVGGAPTPSVAPQPRAVQPTARPSSFARTSFNPSDYALSPPATVPGGTPGAGARSLSLPSAPRLRIPGGAAGGLLIGSLIGALPTEIPRLRDLLSNPQQYWQEQDRQLREQYPFMFPPADTAQAGLLPALRPALSIVPFQGGQSPGVLYNVQVLQTINGADTLVTVQATGPISGIRREYVSGESNNRISFFLQTGAGEIGLGGRVGSGDVSSGINYTIAGAARADGQPDTGGNPAPIGDPNAAPRPALAAPNTFYIEPTPSRVPNSVPYNAPTIAPTPAINPAAPNPFAPPAGVPNSVPTATPTPTANPYAPTAPQVGSRQERQQQTNEGGSIIPWLIPAAAIGALGGWALARQTSRIETPVTPTPTPTPTPFTCRFRDDPFSEQTNVRAGRIEALNLTMQAFQTEQIGVIQNKLGPQLTGGIAGKLGRLGSLASKTWNFLQVDRVLNVFTWFGVLHNAYMLSNNLGQTLFSAIGNTLDAIGIQKVDEEGNEEAYDIGEIVSKFTDNWAKSVFGVETWEGIKTEWKKANRIYQAATNLLNSLQSMTYAVLEGLETVGNYVAKIGNAARIFGVFTEKAFNPMQDNLNFKGGRFFRFLDRADEFIQNIDSISSNVVDIQQTAADCVEQKTTLTTAISDFENSKKTEEDTKKANSQGATISTSDERKPES